MLTLKVGLHQDQDWCWTRIVLVNFLTMLLCNVLTTQLFLNHIFGYHLKVWTFDNIFVSEIV